MAADRAGSEDGVEALVAAIEWAADAEPIAPALAAKLRVLLAQDSSPPAQD
jgi:hypothetical protein